MDVFQFQFDCCFLSYPIIFWGLPKICELLWIDDQTIHIYIHRLAIDPTAYGLRACLVSPTCRDGIAGDLVVTATVASFAKDLNAAQHVDSSGIAGRSKLPQDSMLGIQSLACWTLASYGQLRGGSCRLVISNDRRLLFRESKRWYIAFVAASVPLMMWSMVFCFRRFS